MFRRNLFIFSVFHYFLQNFVQIYPRTFVFRFTQFRIMSSVIAIFTRKNSFAGQTFRCSFVNRLPHFIHVLSLSVLRLGSFFTWLITLYDLIVLRKKAGPCHRMKNLLKLNSESCRGKQFDEHFFKKSNVRMNKDFWRLSNTLSVNEAKEL